MTTVFNIRGTNGSGKTTLARAFLGPYPVDLSEYAAPTTKDPGRRLRYQGTGNDADVLLIGSYATACGGMDKHPAGKGFQVPLDAIRHALGFGAPPCFDLKVKAIICEGVLASGVYGSWAAFDDELRQRGHQMAFVYLHTPAEVCLERIRDRQRAAGKEPAPPGTPDYERMVANVTGKWTGTMATRRKAIADGRLVYDLPLTGVSETMQAIVEGLKIAEHFRAR
jgi:hypothetical protein